MDISSTGCTYLRIYGQTPYCILHTQASLFRGENMNIVRGGKLPADLWRIDLRPIDSLSGSRKKTDQSFCSKHTAEQLDSTLFGERVQRASWIGESPVLWYMVSLQ